MPAVATSARAAKSLLPARASAAARTVARAARRPALLSQALALTAAAVLGLQRRPAVEVARALARRTAGLRGGGIAACDVGAIATAAVVSGRLVPGARCLAVALAAHALLRAAGFDDADVRIGWQRGGAGGLHGHAWVVTGGRVVVGGPVGDEQARAACSLLGERAA